MATTKHKRHIGSVKNKNGSRIGMRDDAIKTSTYTWSVEELCTDV